MMESGLNPEAKKEIFESIEKRFHIVITSALFFPAIWERVLKIASSDAVAVSNEVLSFGVVIAVLLINYLIFEVSKKYHSIFFLKAIRFFLLLILAAFIILFIFLATLKSGPMIGWQEYLYGASLGATFLIPIFLLFLFMGTPVVSNVRLFMQWLKKSRTSRN